MHILTENAVRGVFAAAEYPVRTASIIKVDGVNFGEGAFVSGVSAEKSEKKGIIQCFNNVNHVYAFGQDPESSRYSCTLTVFMQKAGCGNSFQSGGHVAGIVSQYEAKRVSKNPAVVNMSLDTGTVLSGILVGLSVQVADAATNQFNITLAFNDLDLGS